MLGETLHLFDAATILYAGDRERDRTTQTGRIWSDANRSPEKRAVTDAQLTRTVAAEAGAATLLIHKATEVPAQIPGENVATRTRGKAARLRTEPAAGIIGIATRVRIAAAWVIRITARIAAPTAWVIGVAAAVRVPTARIRGATARIVTATAWIIGIAAAIGVPAAGIIGIATWVAASTARVIVVATAVRVPATNVVGIATWVATSATWVIVVAATIRVATARIARVTTRVGTATAVVALTTAVTSASGIPTRVRIVSAASA